MMLLAILVRGWAKGSKIVEIAEIGSNVFPNYRLSIMTILLPHYKEKKPAISFGE